MVGDMVGDDAEGAGTFGFGFGVQYERQLLRFVSVAGRFAYLGADIGIDKVDFGITSFSLEGHGRFYPFGKNLFLDGMLGYANMSLKASAGSESASASRNYIKTGAKLGWRIHLIGQSGLTLEPSFGYYYGIGLDDTFGKQLAGGFQQAAKAMDEYAVILENIIFVGGPRLSLAVGWSF